MRKLKIKPRDHWNDLIYSQGLVHNSVSHRYWNESNCYVFSKREIETIKEAANNIHSMCLDTLQYIIDKDLFDLLGIGSETKELIIRSWNRKDFYLYGRFDFIYDGNSPPKLLEYNADTPTTLLESAVIQRHWREQKYPEYDQFNCIHEKLIDRWSSSVLSQCHFSAPKQSPDCMMTAKYLRDTAYISGMEAFFIDLEDIGYNENEGKFKDLQEKDIVNLFKLYPWEWLLKDEFGSYVNESHTNFIEPVWKMVLNNKGIMALLWKLHKGHPNLIPTYFDLDPDLGESWVRKPFHSREGCSILINNKGKYVENDGIYGAEGVIYQKFCPIQSFEGYYPTLGLWMVGDECCGLSIREDPSIIVNGDSPFVPHYIQDC